MYDILASLKGSYILVFILMGVVTLCIALYDTLFDKEYGSDYYLSMAVYTGLMSAFIIYINTIETPVIAEEIIKGPPPF